MIERGRLMALTERDWQRQVVELAEALGWAWGHFRPAQTSRGWRTPVEGPLGAGFPDLVLANMRQHRVLFVELKREGGKTAPGQDVVLEWLERSGAEVRVWRPSDLEAIAADLQGHRANALVGQDLTPPDAGA